MLEKTFEKKIKVGKENGVAVSILEGTRLLSVHDWEIWTNLSIELSDENTIRLIKILADSLKK